MVGRHRARHNLFRLRRQTVAVGVVEAAVGAVIMDNRPAAAVEASRHRLVGVPVKLDLRELRLETHYHCHLRCHL